MTTTTMPRAGADAPPRVVLVVEYDGTRYHGSQLQRSGTATVQEAMEGALLSLTGQRYRVSAASRTDAGVDALGQVMSFAPRTEMPLPTYVDGLNFYLPQDIAVTAAYWAPPDFDARRSAVSRTYRYTIVNRRARPAVLRHRAAHVREPLDTAKMKDAAAALVGWVDVRPFTGPLPPRRSPVRRFDAARVERRGEIVTVEMEASGFLPHQVRRMAGALVQVGTGRLSVDEFHRIVQAGRPGEAAWTMPAEGLCLVNVRYDGFPPQDEDETCNG